MKALPYAIAGIVTAAAGAVAVAISSDSDDDVDPLVIDKNAIEGSFAELEDGTILFTPDNQPSETTED